MSSIPPMMVQIELDIADLKTRIAQATREIDKIGDGVTKQKAPMESFGVSVKKLAGSFLAFEAVAKATEYLKEAGKAAAIDNKSFDEMRRTMQSVTFATNEQVEATDKQLQKMALVAGKTTKELRPSFDVLVRSTHDVSKSLKLQQIAMDVSAGTGKNLQTVTLAIARSLTGNTAALNRLVPGAKNATDQIAFLKNAFSGAAESAADADPYMRLNATMETLQESVGQSLLPTMQAFAKWFTDNLPLIERLVPIIAGIIAGLGAMKLTQMAVNGIQSLWAGIQTLLASRASATAVAMEAEAVATDAVAVATEGATVATEGFTAALASTGIGAIAIAVGLLTAALLGLNDASAGAGLGPSKAAIAAGDKAVADAQAAARKGKYGNFSYSNVRGVDASKTLDGIRQAAIDKVSQAESDARAAAAKAQAAKDAKAAMDAQNASASAQKLAQAKAALVSAFDNFGEQFAPAGFIQQKVGRIQQAAMDSFAQITKNLKTGLDAGAITQKAASALQSYADKEQAVLERIGAARDALATKYDLAKTLIGDTSKGIAEMLGIDKLGATAQSAISIMDDVAKHVVAYGQNIAKLKASGLSAGLLGEIAQAGVEKGGALASGLAGASQDQIDAVNKSWQAVQDASAGTADQVATAIYGDGVDVSKGLLNGIISQDQALLQTAATMGQKFAKTFSKAVQLASGKTTDAQFAQAMSGYLADNVSPALAKSLTSANATPWVTAPSSPSQTVINTNVVASTNASPTQIANQTISAIKFGLPVSVIGSTN
jgi:hypothetical protein